MCRVIERSVVEAVATSVSLALFISFPAFCTDDNNEPKLFLNDDSLTHADWLAMNRRGHWPFVLGFDDLCGRPRVGQWVR